MVAARSSLGLRQGTLALCDHDPGWAALFAIEAARIATALAEQRFEIDHIGSTATPGLPAKPIVDIALRATDHVRIAAALVKSGYIDRGLRSGRLFIRLRDSDVRTHNLHLYRPDDAEYIDQIVFRDTLRADGKLRADYTALKRHLVETLGDAGRARYAEGKTDFIRSALARAR